MFTVLGAIAIIEGSIPLIKKASEGQDEKQKPKDPEVDPVTAALQAAKTVSNSLPSPIAGHALSKVTDPPSFLVPSHTPNPPLPDLQVLTALLTVCRKHGLNKWGCQSVFVEENGLDMGLWIGSIDASKDLQEEGSGDNWKRAVASTLVERLTNGNSEKDTVYKSLEFISLPSSTEYDDAFKNVASRLGPRIVFRLPEKERTQAYFLVGQNRETKNWVAVIAAAKTDTLHPESQQCNGANGPTEGASSDTAVEKEPDNVNACGTMDTVVESESCAPATPKDKVPQETRNENSEQVVRRQHNGRKRGRKKPRNSTGGSRPSLECSSSSIRGTSTVTRGVTNQVSFSQSNTHEEGKKEIQKSHDLQMRPANQSSGNQKSDGTRRDNGEHQQRRKRGGRNRNKRR